MSLYEIKNSMIDNLLGFDFNMVEGLADQSGDVSLSFVEPLTQGRML